jgi:uncharacterized membrane-anchored protein
MWTFSNSSGIATTVVDFTTELSPLLVGLVSLVLLSAGMIAIIAIRHYLSEQHQSPAQLPLTTPDHRDAA